MVDGREGGRVMDVGSTYATPDGVRVMVYASEEFEVPPRISLRRGGRLVEFALISPDILRCGAVDGVAGSCEDRDCHGSPLRSCRCGRHEYLQGQGFVRRVVA